MESGKWKMGLLSHFLVVGQFVTPAIQTGLTKRVMGIEDIANLALIEAPKKRGSYKKKVNG